MANSDSFEDSLDMIPEGTQATEHTRSTSFDETSLTQQATQMAMI